MKDVAFIGPSSMKGATIARLAQAGDESDRLPMPVRNMIDQPNAARAATSKPHHGGVGRGLVDEHQSGQIKHALFSHPASPCAGHVHSLLFRRRRLFFEADIVPLEVAPHRATAARDPSLAHRRDDLIQRQIRVVGNQRQQKVGVRLQRREATTARLGRDASGFMPPLHPFDCRTGAHVEPFCCLAPRCAELDPLPPLARVTPKNMVSAWTPSPKIESTCPTPSSKHPGKYRFNTSRNLL